MTNRDFVISMLIDNVLEEHIIMVLAIQDIENGPEGFEFNVKDVTGPGIVGQVRYMIERIKMDYIGWQNYIISQRYINFIKYFVWYGGRTKCGWTKREDYYKLLTKRIKELKHEFTGNEEMGTRDRPDGCKRIKKTTC